MWQRGVHVRPTSWGRQQGHSSFDDLICGQMWLDADLAMLPLFFCFSRIFLPFEWNAWCSQVISNVLSISVSYGPAMDDMFVKKVINCAIWHRRLTHGAHGAVCFYLSLFWKKICRRQVPFTMTETRTRLCLTSEKTSSTRRGRGRKVENFHLTHFDLLRNLSIMSADLRPLTRFISVDEAKFWVP